MDEESKRKVPIQSIDNFILYFCRGSITKHDYEEIDYEENSNKENDPWINKNQQ